LKKYSGGASVLVVINSLDVMYELDKKFTADY